MRIVATIAWCLAVVVVAWRLAAARGEHHDAESRGAGRDQDQDQDGESGILNRRFPRPRK